MPDHLNNNLLGVGLRHQHFKICSLGLRTIGLVKRTDKKSTLIGV